jgi:hypothetical protein
VVLSWTIALLSLLRYTLKDSNAFDNIMEWNFVIVTCSYYYVCSLLWQRTQFQHLLIVSNIR